MSEEPEELDLLPDAATLRRALTLGVERVPLTPPADLLRALGDGEERWLPTALALVAHARRVEAPELPRFDDVVALPLPQQPVLSARTRLRLTRACSERIAPDFAAAIWVALERAGRSLHPFDLPALERDLLRSPRAVDEPMLRAWWERRPSSQASRARATTSAAGAADVDASASANDAAQGDTEADELWPTLQIGDRVERLAHLRREDPAGARARLEQVFAKEPAAARARLLDALSTQLSHEDQPFLESLAKDRSRKVQETAAALLGRLPGTDQSRQLLADLVERIESGRRGISLTKNALRLRCPERLSTPQQRIAWALATYATLALDDLCAALELSPKDLAKRSTSDAVLQTLVLVLDALATPNAPTASQLARFLPTAGRSLALQFAVEHPQLGFDRPDVIERLLVADSRDSLPAPHLIQLAFERLPHSEGTGRLAQHLLESNGLHEALAQLDPESEVGSCEAHGEMLAALALHVRPQDRAELEQRLSQYTPAVRGRAASRLALLHAIETDPGFGVVTHNAQKR